MTTEITLSEAVLLTLGKKLTPSRYEAFPHCRTKALRTAYEILLNLGYAGKFWKPRSRKYGSWVRSGHPAAIRFLSVWGDEYVTLLKATQRLTQ